MPSEKKSEREEAWLQMCPADYRATDPARLNRAALKKVLAWRPCPRGLCIVGPPRTGKTRMAWLLLRRLFVDECVWVEALTSTQFAHDCARKFMNGTGEDWVERLGKARVLFLDDLGKFKLTERVEAELFGLVDDRTAWQRPIITTMNMTGDELRQRVSADRSEPLIGRLLEFCEIVVTGR
jgi:DNA replication protein DnaC